MISVIYEEKKSMIIEKRVLFPILFLFLKKKILKWVLFWRGKCRIFTFRSSYIIGLMWNNNLINSVASLLPKPNQNNIETFSNWYPAMGQNFKLRVNHWIFIDEIKINSVSSYAKSSINIPTHFMFKQQSFYKQETPKRG